MMSCNLFFSRLALITITILAMICFHCGKSQTNVASQQNSSIWSQMDTTSEMRGKEIARRLSCFLCHGPAGMGVVADPTSLSGKIPGWDSGTVKMYITGEHEIREWILYGRTIGDSVVRKYGEAEPFIPMPSYKDHLSEQELDDLVAYFKAVSLWDPDIPDDAYEGRKLSSLMGCFGCHGPSGMGGTLPNPGSISEYLTPWNELIGNEKILSEWIMDGIPHYLSENPEAMKRIKQQIIPMPGYHDYLSNDELNKIIAYINWLRKRQEIIEEVSPIG